MLDVLLVDDEEDIRTIVGTVLRQHGHRVTLAADGAQALAQVSARSFDLLICDLRLPKIDGLQLFHRVREISPSTDVILITGHGSIAEAVSALKDGAADYVPKPFDNDEIAIRVARIAEERKLRLELDQARIELGSVDPGRAVIGRSPGMVRLLDRIETFAQSEAPVLITGETGTGKELVARVLHARGALRDKPFVAVSCAAFPETLLEAELFGHERGAFTGAYNRRDGRFKTADGGVLFLDEIAEVPLPAQAKLLRVLEEGLVVPLGSDRPVRVDVRIVSATHRNLKERIQAGRFREDLYYRLKVLEIHIPPLRDRRSDLPLLVSHFLRRLSTPHRPPATLSPRALACLWQHAFPGNVRELAHIIEHGVVVARGGEVDLEHLPAELTAGASGSGGADGAVRPLSFALQEFESEYLRRILGVAAGKRGKAAELLGISRKNLWEKLKRYGIADDGED
jgi:DNA-binding NtrC family response regulator